MLEEILEHKKREVAERKFSKPNFSKLSNSNRNFKEALRGKSEICLIAEIKKASPSKGVIDHKFDYIQIAKDYEKAGVSCISILTDEKFFQGNLSVLKDVSETVNLPLLRKDFIVDPYQVYEAREYGADAVLLIVKALDLGTMQECQKVAHSLGMDVLVEVHNLEELEQALKLDKQNLVIGINNRNLSNLEVDMNTVSELAKEVPKDYVLIAESGYHTKEDLSTVQDKVDAALIGTSIMQSENRIEKIKSLLNGS